MADFPTFSIKNQRQEGNVVGKGYRDSGYINQSVRPLPKTKQENKTQKQDGDNKFSVMELFIAAVIACVLMYFCLGSVGRVDNDNYWQLAHGHEILKNGLYTDEPLSMHEGLAFVYPQWLSILIFTVIYDTFGVIGVNIWYRLIQLVGVYFIYKLMKLITDNEYAGVLLSFAFFIGYSSASFSTRPFVISQTFIAIELYVLEKYIRTKKQGILIWLPVMSVLWINLHNSLWAFLFILMMPMLAEYLFCKWKKRDLPFEARPVLSAGAAAGLVGLINPYGESYILYLAKSAGAVNLGQNFIIELYPSSISNTGAMAMIIAAILLVCIALVFNKKEKTVEDGNTDEGYFLPAAAPLRYWFLFGGTFVLAMMHVRNITIFFMGAMPILCYYASQLLRIPKDDSLGRVFRKTIVIFFVIFSALCIKQRGDAAIDAPDLDKEALSYMEENISKDSNVFATINSGGMLELNGYKTFVDTRLEVFSETMNGKGDYLAEYFDLQNGVLWPGDLIKEYDFDVFYIQKNILPTMYEYLKNTDGYESVYEDDDIVIYIPEADQTG